MIHVQHLSKKYQISHEKKENYLALRDVITQRAKGIFSFKSKRAMEDFWALDDINFTIAQGERVGIIGRNGAGKSTLLKILSRITEPTSGVVKIKGRVSSLLEVGTGFHPELTGRENIFLNGAIIGMTRAEIKKHFDAIVDFAEIENFLDTPVKRYSSGMYVRLAFAVAAHLEPEILIIDEVLAVGDSQFQKKCLGKMEDVSRNEGRTVLFVSHNLTAIKSLCTSAIVLNKGKKIFQGDVPSAVTQYLGIGQQATTGVFNRGSIPAGKQVYISSIEITDDTSKNEFCLNLMFRIISKLQTRIGINIRLFDSFGSPVAFGCTNYFNPALISLDEGENDVQIISGNLSLAIGNYKIGVELVYPGTEILDSIDDCIGFEISGDTAANRHLGVMQSWGYGSVEILFETVRTLNIAAAT